MSDVYRFSPATNRPAWKFLLDLHVGRIGKRAKIIEPLVNDLAEIYRRQMRFEDDQRPCATTEANRRSRQSNDAFDEAVRTIPRRSPA